MTLQTSKGKVPRTHKELIRRIITFECEKLEKDHWKKKKNKPYKSYMPGAF